VHCPEVVLADAVDEGRRAGVVVPEGHPVLLVHARVGPTHVEFQLLGLNEADLGGRLHQSGQQKHEEGQSERSFHQNNY